MPPPYPKACVHCAKSKKRCDLGVPCARCQIRSLDCCYKTLQGSAEQLLSRPFPIADSQLFTEDAQSRELGQFGQAMDINDIGFGTPSPLDFDRDWPEIMKSIDQFVVPDQIGLFDSPERSVLAGDIYQERIVYSVKRLQSYPSLFVRQGHTPFLNLDLYKENIPPAIQDALGVSALYNAKNEANQTLIFTTINQKAKLLIDSPSHSERSAFEQLAMVQALVLYQIIRLFDGDIRLRADAERAEATLIDWARELQLLIERTGAEASSGLKSTLNLTADPWRGWLLAESQRRTVIMCFALQGLYCFLKNGWDSSHHDFEHLSFFAQKALWTAPSEYYWRSAIDNHRLLPVHFRTWDADMVGAKPSDVDELGIMMMALMKGVDHCAEWVGERYLDTYGLTLHRLE